MRSRFSRSTRTPDVAEDVAAWAPTCYSLAYAILDDRESAVAVLIEVFADATRNAQYSRMRTRRTRASGRTLIAATHRAAVSARRSAGTTAPSSLAQRLVASTDPLAADAPQLDAVLRSLEPEDRRTLILAYFGGCRVDQIAAMEQISVQAVTARLASAIRRLRAAHDGPVELIDPGPRSDRP